MQYIVIIATLLFLLPNASQAAEWKTYRNSEFKFQFTYPPSWKHISCDGITQEGICGYSGGRTFDAFGSGYLTVHAKRASLEELFNDESEMFRKTDDGHIALAVPAFLGSENISGKDWKGIIFSYACSNNDNEGNYHHFGGECYEAVIHYNGISIVLDVGNSVIKKSTFKQIIKSIKFAD